MSKLINRETVFNPCQDYYFLDYHHIEQCKWVRCPMSPMQEVVDVIHTLPYAYEDVSKSYIPLFRNLRITPYSKLEELHRSFNKETDSWEDDEFTVGYYMFDDRYDQWDLLGCEPSLTKKKEESDQEWKNRVQVYRDKCDENRKSRYQRDDLHGSLYRINPKTLEDYYYSLVD